MPTVSSSRSDRPSARGALRALLLLLSLAAACAGAAEAGYAVRVELTDPSGARVLEEGDDAWYVWYRRTNYRDGVGPDGRPFKDEEMRTTAFPSSGRRIKFSNVLTAAFEWKREGDREVSTLRIETTAGETVEIPGARLEGAAHPLSPLLEYRVGGEVRRILLNPLTPAERRRGQPSLVTVAFPGNKDLRPPSRRTP